MFLLATFAPMLNLDDSYPKKLVFVWILAFAVNVFGLTLGVVEHKKGCKKALIGVIGHSLLLTLFLTIMITALVKY